MRSAVSRSRLARGSAASSRAGSARTPRRARASLTRVQLGLTRTPPASRNTASRLIARTGYDDLGLLVQLAPEPALHPLGLALASQAGVADHLAGTSLEVALGLLGRALQQFHGTRRRLTDLSDVLLDVAFDLQPRVADRPTDRLLRLSLGPLACALRLLLHGSHAHTSYRATAHAPCQRAGEACRYRSRMPLLRASPTEGGGSAKVRLMFPSAAPLQVPPTPSMLARNCVAGWTSSTALAPARQGRVRVKRSPGQLTKCCWLLQNPSSPQLRMNTAHMSSWGSSWTWMASTHTGCSS